MRAIRLLSFFVLALAFGMSFVLGPVSATSEHPWSEDPYYDYGDTNGGSGSNSMSTDSESSPGSGIGDLGFGSDLFWFYLLTDGISDDGATNSTSEADNAAKQE